MRSPGRPPVCTARASAAILAAISRALSSAHAALDDWVCRRRSVRAGSASKAGCDRSAFTSLSGRYLSFSEREEIAILHAAVAMGARDRPPARSCSVDGLAELRRKPRPERSPRNRARTHSGTRPAGATPEGVQARSEGLAYVQERLAGAITAADGTPLPSPCAGGRRQSPAGSALARSWSPEQIANRCRSRVP